MTDLSTLREGFARIISGAPFPSARSFDKADQILAAIAPILAERSAFEDQLSTWKARADALGVRLETLEKALTPFLTAFDYANAIGLDITISDCMGTVLVSRGDFEGLVRAAGRGG